MPSIEKEILEDEGADKRLWLGYGSKEEETEANQKYRNSKQNLGRIEGFSIQEINKSYEDLEAIKDLSDAVPDGETNPPVEDEIWRMYWAASE
eukprot:scaffold2632_cov158-Amphora_coffeaeformis.AAC.12